MLPDRVEKIRSLFPSALRSKLPREIRVISATEIVSRRLNRRYRAKDKPTNVLSFFYSPEYGEIIVCPAVIRVEAKTQANPLQYQMTWMVVHGMLHLSGVHHEHSRSAEARFQRIERRIMAGLFQIVPKR